MNKVKASSRIADTDLELGSNLDSQTSSRNLLVTAGPSLMVPSLEKGKVSEIELPTALQKDYKVNY